MNVALEATGLSQRYGRVWALRDCDVKIPVGRVVGLVGPNGAGKTTLLHLAVGLLTPTSGELRVFDWSPSAQPTLVLSRVGFLAQDRPLYEGFSVEDTLQLGRHLNPRWDMPYAKERLARLEIPLERKIRALSGGQRAQIALTLALGKRPDLLLLDEPVANLDPLARREFLQDLMTAVADDRHTVVLSTHVIADLERVCDYLIILMEGRIRLAGDIEQLVRSHALVVGPRVDDAATRGAIEVVQADRQTTRLVRTNESEEAHVYPDGTAVRPASLEEIVLAYLRTSPKGVEEAA